MIRPVLAIVVMLSACTSAARPTIDIATTTSVQNSGLLDYLLPNFESAQVRVHAAGSGRSLEMLADGVVDRGRDRLSEYRIDGRIAFTVWPNTCPGHTPDARPCETPITALPK